MKKTLGLLLCAVLFGHQADADHETSATQAANAAAINTLCNSDVSALLTPDRLDYYQWACQTAPREQGET